MNHHWMGVAYLFIYLFTHTWLWSFELKCWTEANHWAARITRVARCIMFVGFFWGAEVYSKDCSKSSEESWWCGGVEDVFWRGHWWLVRTAHVPDITNGGQCAWWVMPIVFERSQKEHSNNRLQRLWWLNGGSLPNFLSFFHLTFCILFSYPNIVLNGYCLVEIVLLV